MTQLWTRCRALCRRAPVALSLPVLAGCGRLGTPREPVVSVSERPEQAVVRLQYARLPQPLTALAVHYWLVAYDPRRGAWERWEVMQEEDLGPPSWGHVYKDLLAPDSDVGGGPPVVERQWTGAPAERLLAALRASPSYPNRGTYRAWPGPNSNTYVAWVLRQAGVSADMHPLAVGRDQRGWLSAGVTTTATGVFFLSPLVGLKLGALDGVEVSVLGLTVGLKPYPPALKTPVMRLGFAEQ